MSTGRCEAGEGGASPEGREGLVRQIFQAFQLHPAGRDGPQLLRRHGGMRGTVQTASLLSALHPPPACFLISLAFFTFQTALKVTGFLGTATCWVGKLLHPHQSPLPPGGSLPALRSSAGRAQVPSPGRLGSLMPILSIAPGPPLSLPCVCILCRHPDSG